MNLDERTFLQTVGLRLRQAREAANLTQAELGRRCELHRTFIGSVERGERNISVLNLRLMARALRLSLGDLLAESSDEAGQE